MDSLMLAELCFFRVCHLYEVYFFIFSYLCFSFVFLKHACLVSTRCLKNDPHILELSAHVWRKMISCLGANVFSRGLVET